VAEGDDLLEFPGVAGGDVTAASQNGFGIDFDLHAKPMLELLRRAINRP
jgi:hypothetical protein